SPFGLPWLPCVGGRCAVWPPPPPPPPILLPPPPLPLLVPVVRVGPERPSSGGQAPGGPEGEGDPAPGPRVPQADPLGPLPPGFVALGALLGLGRLAAPGGRRLPAKGQTYR